MLSDIEWIEESLQHGATFEWLKNTINKYEKKEDRKKNMLNYIYKKEVLYLFSK